MIAKAGLGLVGLGAVGIGGVAFAKPEWLGINKEIPWTPLSQDKDFKSKTSDYGEDKFGGKYKNYLTGLVGTEKTNNDSWWQKSYEQWEKDYEAETTKDNLGNKFKDKIVGAIKPVDGTGQYLREICDTIYKVAHGNIVASPGTTEADKYKESSVWKYCSPLGQKPTTVKNHDNSKSGEEVYKEVSGTTPIGKDEENDLISVNDKKNNKFWDIRNKEFHGKDPFTKKASINGSTDEFFKQGQKDEKHIKDLCTEAYTKKSADTSSATAPTKAETKKFCSFESITTA